MGAWYGIGVLCDIHCFVAFYQSWRYGIVSHYFNDYGTVYGRRNVRRYAELTKEFGRKMQENTYFFKKDFKKDFDYDIICHEYSCIHV